MFQYMVQWGGYLEKSLVLTEESLPQERLDARTHFDLDIASVKLAPKLTSWFVLEDIGNLFGQITGLHDWFNEMLVGDPRGICFQKGCGEFVTVVIITVENFDGLQKWKVKGEGIDKKSVLLEEVLRDVLDAALEPIL